jgi:hypothetical protein
MLKYNIVCLALLCAAPGALSQEVSERMSQLEQRMAELEKKYQSDLAQRDAEITKLKNQLHENEAKSASASPATEKSIKTVDEILKGLDSKESKPEIQRTAANFNPDFAIIGNWQGNASSRNDNPARNRFDLGSVELDLRGAVDPRADAVVILPFYREVEDELFFEKDDVSGDVDSGVEIEEAYLFLHDFGVENLTAKLGRFHLKFGRWNQLHQHNWATVDNAFAVASFMGPEAYGDSGISLSYVIPPKLVNDEYIEAVLEIVTGEGGEESPVINSDAFTDAPALNAHLLWNHNFGSEWNMELGASAMLGKHDDTADAWIFGSDFTLLHTDPTGRFNNQLFQGELFYNQIDGIDGGSLGAYLLAQQQLNRDWYAGVRLDWTQNGVDSKQEIWGVSPYVSWYLSEFLRLRMEYQHRNGDIEDENILWFQVNFVFGAHPPHPYWAMR